MFMVHYYEIDINRLHLTIFSYMIVHYFRCVGTRKWFRQVRTFNFFLLLIVLLANHRMLKKLHPVLYSVLLFMPIDFCWHFFTTDVFSTVSEPEVTAKSAISRHVGKINLILTPFHAKT